ncbi:MAG: hypothetical protein JKY53_03320 [Flavobacteriales bacterium]|nr:hypothetical protein [Flavobacteriales bacterium]
MIVRIFALIGVLLVSKVALSQDIIWKKTGEKIEAKVIKISDEEIKYQKHNNLSGPIYSIETYNVIQITFENGDVEKINANRPSSAHVPSYSRAKNVDNINSPNSNPRVIENDEGRFYADNRKIGRRTVENWLKKLNNPESRALYDKSVRMRKSAYYFLGAAAGVGIITYQAEFILLTGGYILAVGGPIAAVLLVTNIVLIRRYKIVQSNAIEKYNEALKLTNKYEEKE